jgi:branched-chain amino acid transport system permease protein
VSSNEQSSQSVSDRFDWSALRKSPYAAFAIFLALPALDLFLPDAFHIAHLLRQIFIFAIVALGLNIVTGYTGLLHLGVAGFMAVGAYAFSIFTCDIYPFQLGFWLGLLATGLIGMIPGLLLGLPALRLRGDYLAIVTLGFGEIIQDVLKNLEAITRGTQGINPLPAPTFLGFVFTSDNYLPWYYLLLCLLALLVWFSSNLEHSRIGRSWEALREDELAASCMGVATANSKLLAFVLASAFCSIGGALFASSLSSSGEPSNYDFQISIITLCSVIVGGMGSIRGVLVGSLFMVGFNSIVLQKLSAWLASSGLITSTNVYLTPNNWKYMFFGVVLIIMMRIRPDGLIPSKTRSFELAKNSNTGNP